MTDNAKEALDRLLLEDHGGGYHPTDASISVVHWATQGAYITRDEVREAVIKQYRAVLREAMTVEGGLEDLALGVLARLEIDLEDD